MAICVQSLRRSVWSLGQPPLIFLGLVLLMSGCGASDHATLTAPTAASPAVEQQAITSLLDLYRQALLQEDIDRLQALLTADAEAFRTTMSTTFRTLTLTGVEIPAETV